MKSSDIKSFGFRVSSFELTQMVFSNSKLETPNSKLLTDFLPAHVRLGPCPSLALLHPAQCAVVHQSQLARLALVHLRSRSLIRWLCRSSPCASRPYYRP